MGFKIPRPQPPATTTGTVDQADLEGVRIAEGDLDADAKAQDHHRNQNIKHHVFLITRASLWVAFGTAVVIALVFVFHLVAPDDMHFLSADSNAALKGVVYGALASGLMQQLARKALQLPEPERKPKNRKNPTGSV